MTVDVVRVKDRQLELRLLPGIKDIDGLELVPRNGQPAEGIVDVIRYVIGA